MPEDRSDFTVLARITDTPHLARAVPLLRPDVLHAVIAHYGLQDCGDLVALATPQQLSAVFDLDLWKAPRAGATEQFDPARFCEWLEVLVDAGAEMAADRLAQQDVALVVAGLSPAITVWDPVVFYPVIEQTGADAVQNPGRELGVHAEIGGHIVVARETAAWDAIVDVLLALDERHPAIFHRIMRACSKLSDSGRELDGLDDLLPDAAQHRFDLDIAREARRERVGFLAPEHARAFLASARHVSLAAGPPVSDAVFAAYQCSVTEASETEEHSETESVGAHGQHDARPETSTAVARVMEVLHSAGVVADAPRPLLAGAPDDASPLNAALKEYVRSRAEADDAESTALDQELAFLANALVAGCSVQSRRFSRREAADAVAATCNLGLECWPQHWPESSTQRLVTVFQVGWSVVHREISLAAADGVLDALDNLQINDPQLQFGLRVLGRELRKERAAGTPWRACERLENLSPLDLPAWAALTSLFDECPVMLANVSAPRDRPALTLNPSEFQFVAERQHVAAIHEFLRSLPALLTG
jgi:hypothetical protein